MVSSAYTSLHILVTHMRTHLPCDCHPVFVSLEWARLCRVFPFHFDVVARLLTDLETRRFGILLFHRTGDTQEHQA